MSITYGILEETHELGEERRTSYGIAAYLDAEHSHTAAIAATVCDITDDKTRLQALVALCNELQLDLVHLDDIIEDFFAQ